MHTLQIANTFFEAELEASQERTLYEAFHLHPIFLQLQFLPAVYASPQDTILLSDPPPKNYPILKSVTLDQKAYAFDKIETWGHSRWVAKWAAEQNIEYKIPDWDVVLKVNSKEFSFSQAPRLPHAELLFDEVSVLKWARCFSGTKVLKTCFGLSGTGHFLLTQDTSAERLSLFLRKEFSKGNPIIAEPWVERLFDFSTQWEISPQGTIAYLGATLCKNDDKGQYQFSRVGNEEALFGKHLHFLKEHKEKAFPVLKKMASLGFFGNVGCDAMVYVEKGNNVLHPLVEINARKTMGWAALKYQQLHYPQETLQFSYSKNSQGLLPKELEDRAGKIIHFLRNLQISKINENTL